MNANLYIFSEYYKKNNRYLYENETFLDISGTISIVKQQNL